MNPKTTTFSAHLSRSMMSRYLHQQLAAQQASEVERHLLVCEHCANNFLQFVQTESPEEYKTYQKQLKEKFSVKKPVEKKVVSHTRVKVFRAAAAVSLLFVFSFFAVKTVMHKNIMDQEISEAQIKPAKSSKQEPTVAAFPVEEKIQEPIVETKKLVEKTARPETTQTEKVAKTVTKSPVASASSEKDTKPQAVKAKQQPAVQEPAPEKAETQPGDEQDQAANEEKTEQRPAIMPLPKIEKLDIQPAEAVDIKIEPTLTPQEIDVQPK